MDLLSLKPAWSVQQVRGQPRLGSETLSQKTDGGEERWHSAQLCRLRNFEEFSFSSVLFGEDRILGEFKSLIQLFFFFFFFLVDPGPVFENLKE